MQVAIHKYFVPKESEYVGKTIDAIDSEKVIVEWKETTGTDRILMRKSE